ncbi:type II secretion system F family protein [Patescibacteria group bacterium]|nr:type II secretion system F family protein [Patescibacteria group bacterium]MBU4057580.1 type II secretion system F family protein [Patescibacteria group bacterium]MBU4115706.1 type II secretion system F family protein [Patescibacteria group bacterium]
MLFKYKVIDAEGLQKSGEIDAINVDVAINSLQRRGFVVVSVDSASKVPFFEKKISFFDKVSNKDVVILSRQIATLFDAQVSALKIFNLLAVETENPVLRSKLAEISSDLKAGNSVSKSMGKHTDVFSDFYINMVRSGEESGKLEQTFLYLADYLDRSYELTSKAKNALVYPIFIIFTFVSVMILMLTTVIPRISSIIAESGQTMPFYTRAVVGISDLLVNYGVFLIILLIIGAFFLWKYAKTEAGKLYLSRLKISIPFIGGLYRKLYLSRISDNMHTMLASGISMVRSIEVTGTVVGNKVYENIIKEAAESIKAGKSVSESFSKHEEIPSIMVQMMKVGEETGELGSILKTLSNFYRREVINAVDTLVSLIEPVMIVILAVGVGLLLASVLIPIYNISAGV